MQFVLIPFTICFLLYIRQENLYRFRTATALKITLTMTLAVCLIVALARDFSPVLLAAAVGMLLCSGGDFYLQYIRRDVRKFTRGIILFGLGQVCNITALFLLAPYHWSGLAVLAALCALVSVLFCGVIHGMEHLMAKYLPNPWVRVVTGGFAVIALTYLCGTTDYNGAGMEVVERAMGGQVDGWAWILKLLFTAVTIGFGFKGGEVVPSFFVGACFGCLLGGFLGLPAGFGAAIGLVAVFCGAVNCPIASVFLSIELFGTGDLLYFAMACAISYLLSGYCGLYSSQTILYSKMRAEFINIHTNENEEHHG